MPPTNSRTVYSVVYRTRRQIIGLTEPSTPDGDVVARLGTVASRVTAHSQLIGHSFLAALAASHILMPPKRTLLAVDAIQVPLVPELRSQLAVFQGGPGLAEKRSYLGDIYHFSST